MAQAFNAGPHGQPSLAGNLPGCLACHTTHGTARIPPEQVEELCATCHDADGSIVGLAGEIEEELLHAGQELAAATHSIEEMEASGRAVADERFRYLAAYTAYKQFGRAQHSLDLDQLEELGRQVRSNTGVINATAEAYAEERWEHKLWLIPIWFLTLSALTLALFKLRDLEH
jgi:cytochrome c553